MIYPSHQLERASYDPNRPPTFHGPNGKDPLKTAMKKQKPESSRKIKTTPKRPNPSAFPKESRPINSKLTITPFSANKGQNPNSSRISTTTHNTHNPHQADPASFHFPPKKREVTPEMRRTQIHPKTPVTPPNHNILQKPTTLSKKKPDNQPEDDALVSRRNSFFSYDGTEEAFLEKIVNNTFEQEMQTNQGLLKYINQCRQQVATAKDLKLHLLTQPFMGVRVELPRLTGSKPLP
jgi:hypothetical protein